MKHFLIASVGILTAALAFSSAARSQDTPTRGPGQVDQRPPSVYEKLANSGPGGPAPAHDLTGFWNGPLEPKFADKPSLTPLGQSKFKMNIPDPFSAHSNDPWRTCDPFGFPRSATNETRGLAFAPMPQEHRDHDPVLKNLAHGVDGRTPASWKNFGTKGGPSSRWYGYSIGHWGWR